MMDFSMIFDSLKVLLFGMAGVFVVMLLIMLSLVILHRLSRKTNKNKPEESE